MNQKNNKENNMFKITGALKKIQVITEEQAKDFGKEQEVEDKKEEVEEDKKGKKHSKKDKK